VLEHSFDSIIKHILSHGVPCLIYAGTRSDRRGKFRLIFSFDGNFRIIDYLLNNGSYDMCEGRGPLSKYTTEGFNNMLMWIEMMKMANRSNNYAMVCLDYKGYDTQISMREYLSLSMALNKYRLHDNVYSDIISWYSDWMSQPKPVITRSSDVNHVLLSNCNTLASGLHGTHSYENFIGISTMIESRIRGIDIPNFWSNGDDQNARVKSSHLDNYMKFIDGQFDVNWQKSLIGHKLAVWGKLWFASDIHPFWEIGTLRSIWEREGGETSMVESSKFQANYCKILQTIITLIRLRVDNHKIVRWMNSICDEANIDPSRIPVKLNNLKSTVSSKSRGNDPEGLRSVKEELMNKTYRLIGLNANNYYDMLNNMYSKRQFFSLDLDEVKYHSSGTNFRISRSVNYSRMVPNDIPWIYKDIYLGEEYSMMDKLNRDLLQGTKSYDGPCSKDFSYHDMLSLAHALNNRNELCWRSLRY
jgi:hypothetical protein